MVISMVSAGAVQAQTGRGNMFGLRGGAATTGRGMMGDGQRVGKGITGKITAISGSIITLVEGTSTAKTLTIDASKATFAKIASPIAPSADSVPAQSASSPIAIADLVVGDMIVVTGTVTDTTVVATQITVVPARAAWEGNSTMMVVGKVQAINGTTLTVLANSGFGRMGAPERANNSNAPAVSSVTYAVDASAAVIKKIAPSTAGQTVTAPTTIAVGDIAIGDTVRVQGKITGTNIAAVTITDGFAMMNIGRANDFKKLEDGKPSKGEADALKAEVEAVKPGLWEKITSFFSGLFGKRNK